MNHENDQFIQLLTASQSPLYACILSLLPNRTAAQDILQETNLTLWHKSDEYQPGTNFMAWASRIARYHILNYRRKQSRDKLLFDGPLFEELCAKQAARAEDSQHYAEHLRNCLEKLPTDQQELVRKRYSPGGVVKEIADARKQSVGAISQLLYRIRESLLNCVTLQMQESGS